MDRLLLFERMSTNHMTKKIEKKFHSFAAAAARATAYTRGHSQHDTHTLNELAKKKVTSTARNEFMSPGVCYFETFSLFKKKKFKFFRGGGARVRNKKIPKCSPHTHTHARSRR